jgi:hypothetical protein
MRRGGEGDATISSSGAVLYGNATSLPSLPFAHADQPFLGLAVRFCLLLHEETVVPMSCPIF